MNGIASIGECMLELTGSGSDWRMGHSGDTFNVIWTMRALLPADRPTDYVSAFGDDTFSGQQLAFFAENGIGTASSPRIPGARPGLYAISLDGAERSFTYWRADAAARHLADDASILSKSLQNRSLVYFSGITVAILDDAPRATLLNAVDAVRRAGSLVAFDPNYRPRLWASTEAARTAIAAALSVADIVLPTFPDEQALYGDQDPAATAKRVAGAGPREIVVKDGAEPALVVAGTGSTAVAATHVANPVDTTGAGDSFNGGYLAARLLGHDPVEAARRAHRVAAAAVQVRGALAPVQVLREAFEG